MNTGWGASPPSMCLGRLVVIGGSSASGYGLTSGSSYAAQLADENGLELVELIEHAILTHRARRLLRNLSLTSSDVLVLHIGMWDTRAHLPRSWMRLVFAARSGRGRLEGFPSDMRTWSRVRRTIAVYVDRVVTATSHLLGRHAPTPIPVVVADGTAIERSLADFTGRVVVVLPERAPYMPAAHNPVTRKYAAAFNSAIVEARSARSLPVASIDLTDELRSGDYQEDGFHPNELGHKKVASALQSVLGYAPSGVGAPRL